MSEGSLLRALNVNSPLCANLEHVDTLQSKLPGFSCFVCKEVDGNVVKFRLMKDFLHSGLSRLSLICLNVFAFL